MSTQQAALSRGRANLALATLFLGTVVLGTAELLVVGVLNLIAADLQISVPAAGALVAANALLLAIGGPILTALTIKLNKRTTLIGTLMVFILANLVPVLTADYGPFLAARVVAGALAQSLSASAINVGIAFGSFAGGVAIGSFTASSAVLTGLVIAVIAIPVAWATSFLKPPQVEEVAEPVAAAPMPEAA